MAKAPSKRQQAALDRLHSRRQEAESRLADLRHSLDRELGAWAPTRAVWILPMVAFACGVALALASRQRQSSEPDADA